MANAKIALLGLAALVALSLGATADAAPETCAPIRQNATFNAKVDQALSPLFRKLDGMKDKNTAATKSAALSASVKRLGNSQKYRMNEKVQCLVAILVEKIDAQTSKLRSAVDNDEEFLNDVAAAVRGTDTSEPNSPTPSNPSGQGNPSSQTSSSSASTSGTQTSGGTPSDYTIGMGACILTTLDKVNLTQAGYKDSTGSSSSVLWAGNTYSACLSRCDIAIGNHSKGSAMYCHYEGMPAKEYPSMRTYDLRGKTPPYLSSGNSSSPTSGGTSTSTAPTSGGTPTSGTQTSGGTNTSQTSGGTSSDYTIGMGACILTTLDKVNLTQAGYKDSTGSSSSVLWAGNTYSACLSRCDIWIGNHANGSAMYCHYEGMLAKEYPSMRTYDLRGKTPPYLSSGSAPATPDMKVSVLRQGEGMWLKLVISDGGPNVKQCIAAGNGAACTPTDTLTQGGGWSYNSSTRSWTFDADVSNIAAPGQAYTLRYLRDDGKTASAVATVTKADPYGGQGPSVSVSRTSGMWLAFTVSNVGPSMSWCYVPGANASCSPSETVQQGPLWSYSSSGKTWTFSGDVSTAAAPGQSYTLRFFRDDGKSVSTNVTMTR